jgi:hypothetical protein
MTSVLLFACGLAFLSVGLLLALRPSLAQWIADRASRPYAKQFPKEAREFRDDLRRRMRHRIPLGLIYIGGLGIAIAVYKWFR